MSTAGVEGDQGLNSSTESLLRESSGAFQELPTAEQCQQDQTMSGERCSTETTRARTPSGKCSTYFVHLHALLVPVMPKSDDDCTVLLLQGQVRFQGLLVLHVQVACTTRQEMFLTERMA